MLSDERLRDVLRAQLTAQELDASVIYVAAAPLARGTNVRVPGVTMELPWDGFLAFVDLDPMANWGHACRYVLINQETGEVRATAAQFPPFGKAREGEPPREWRVLYQAPRVPDAVLAVASGARQDAPGSPDKPTNH